MQTPLLGVGLLYTIYCFGIVSSNVIDQFECDVSVCGKIFVTNEMSSDLVVMDK